MTAKNLRDGAALDADPETAAEWFPQPVVR
jgi:hypothetical protein